MKVKVPYIQFRIDIDFPDCEVDMVLRTCRAQTPILPSLTDGALIPIDESKLPLTPTEDSVDFCLHWLAGYVDRNEMCTVSSKWDKDFTKPSITAISEQGTEYTIWPKEVTELEALGVTVESWYGLMQGTCHLVCKCPYEDYSEELVNSCIEIAQKVFEKYAQYYSPVEA